MHNPYAPPATLPRSTKRAFSPGAPQPWQVGEVFAAALRAYKANWLPLTTAAFLQTVMGTVLQEVPSLLAKREGLGHSAEIAAIFVGLFVGLLVQSFFMVGLMRMCLAAARGGTAMFGDLAGGASHWLPCFAVMLVAMLGVLGYALLIVPGVIVSASLMVAFFFVIDADMTAVEAMRASWRASKGSIGKLFAIWLGWFALSIVGLAACGIGFFAATAIYYLATAIVYLRMTGQGHSKGHEAP